METISDRKMPQARMLDQMVQVLQSGKPQDPPAYTWILGAGASFGVVPTAKQMLGISERGFIDPQCIPAFLSHRKFDRIPTLEELPTVVTDFWAGFAAANPDLMQSKIKLDSGVPGSRFIAESYKALFDCARACGINSPADAREYFRGIMLSQGGQIRLNGTHFFLASLLSMQRHAHDVSARQKGLYIGKRPLARTIITTNFDPLLQVSLQLFQLLYYMTDRPELLAVDALHTDDHPALHLFYAHGSVHRPFLANGEPEIAMLKEKNAHALAGYLGQHGVIVLGYSGWDDCLLKALNQTTNFAHNLYWLARSESSLSDAVQRFLLGHPNAYWVEIRDGGDFMAALHSRLCPAMKFSELLENPIPFLHRQLERVDLSNIEIESVNEKADKAAPAIDRGTSPEGFRKQVIEILKEAEKHFQETSASGGILAQLARIQHQADLAYSKKDWAEAIRLFGEIVDNSRSTVELRVKAYFRRANALDKLGKTAGAITDYTSAIELPGAPADTVVKVFYNRGICLGKQGKTAEAIADFTHAIELPGAPDEYVAMAFVNRGNHFERLGKAAKAIADYTSAIELPGNAADTIATALFNRGLCFGQQGKKAEAIADYTRVIELSGAPASLIEIAGKRRDALNELTGG